jgi:hypothetical protein
MENVSQHKKGRMKKDIHQWALTLIGASRREFDALIASLTADQRRAVGALRQWSPKDEIVHLAYWLEVFVGNIQARQHGRALTDTRDYLSLNDQTWHARKDWTWDEAENALKRAFMDIEGRVKGLSSQDLTDPDRLSLEPEGKSPRPLLKALIYELIDHPVHHFVGLYRKRHAEHEIAPMLERLLEVMNQPGVSKWSASTRRKLKRYAE